MINLNFKTEKMVLAEVRMKKFILCFKLIRMKDDRTEKDHL